MILNCWDLDVTDKAFAFVFEEGILLQGGL